MSTWSYRLCTLSVWPDRGAGLGKIKISTTIDEKLVQWIDELVVRGLFRNRSHIVEEALKYVQKNGVEKIIIEKIETIRQ